MRSDTPLSTRPVQKGNRRRFRPPLCRSVCSGLLLLFFLLLPGLVRAESIPLQEIIDGIKSSFSLPWEELLEKEHPSEWRNLFSGFSGNISFDFPLAKEPPRESEGRQTQGERSRNMTVNATIRYNPLSYWFFSATFYHYLDSDLQAPWDPDFSYTFGYDDWHPYTLSLVYANYGGNRLNPGPGESFTRFEEGTFSLGFKFPFPSCLENLFTVHPTGGLSGILNYNLTPKYFDLDDLEKQDWKQSFSLNLKYPLYEWWYATVTLYYYPDPGRQQPWDPDYTYGFGYFDWHAGTITVQYNNYSGNRYPWRDREDDTGRFRDGSIMIAWSWAW